MRADRFLDTNVLLYAVSDDPGETEKRTRAAWLIEQGGWGTSVQVLQEFYVQATRATRRHRLEHHTAAALIECWLEFPLQENTRGTLLDALRLRAETGYSYWDCGIVAAAQALGCREIASENLQHGRVLGGVTIRNPFRL